MTKETVKAAGLTMQFPDRAGKTMKEILSESTIGLRDIVALVEASGETTETLTVRLPREMVSRIQALATTQDITSDTVIWRAVNRLLRDELLERPN